MVSRTPGTCNRKLSQFCAGVAKEHSNICKSCWGVATPEIQEENKQACPGWYCQEFACWNPALVAGRYCRAHGGKIRSASARPPPCGHSNSGAGSTGAAWLGLDPRAALLIQEADAEQLRLIVAAAVDRLAVMASRQQVSE